MAIDNGDDPAAAGAAEPRPEPVPTTEAIQTVSRRRWTWALVALAASLIVLVALGWVAASLGEVLWSG